MSILEQIISVIAPLTCLGCQAETSRLLCEACRETMPQVTSRCYICRAVTTDFAVCQKCHASTPLRRVAVVQHHAELAKELVHHAKYERAKSGLWEMAQMMAPLLSYYDTDVVLVHVPTANNRVRERGYDHALILSKQCGKYTSLPTAQLLKRKGRAHQVGSSRAQRLRQLQGAFRVTQRADIREKYIILVDDVLTSGATLETAARELRRVGAKQVDALVFAQAVR